MFNFCVTKFKICFYSFRKISNIKLIQLKKKMSQGFDPISNTIRTFVFFDLETTGLLSREGKNCRIVEISLLAVLREHLLLKSSFPRVLQKLSLCINPTRLMDATAMSIHGISNTMIENLPEFSNEDYILISTFLNRLPPPVCLLAHNGTCFDFPLLKSELHRLDKSLPDDLLCVDTLPGFRSQLKIYLENRELINELEKLNQYDSMLNDGNDELLFLTAEKYETLHNETLDLSAISTASQTEEEMKQRKKLNKNCGSLYWRQLNNESSPSKRKTKQYYCYKLNEIYKVLLSKTPISHRAENDVMNLLECVHIIGQPFVQWIDKNAYEFKNVRVYS